MMPIFHSSVVYFAEKHLICIIGCREAFLDARRDTVTHRIYSRRHCQSFTARAVVARCSTGPRRAVNNASRDRRNAPLGLAELWRIDIVNQNISAYGGRALLQAKGLWLEKKGQNSPKMWKVWKFWKSEQLYFYRARTCYSWKDKRYDIVNIR